MLIDSWPNSERAWERAKRSLAGGVSTGMRASMKPHPLFFARGSGPRLTDVDGHSYLDYVLGWGPVILGHGHPRLTDAVARVIPDGATFGSGHAAEYEAAERVLDAIPGAERVIWSNTGSEATQVALRMARAATGRMRFVKMLGHYHGWSDTFLLGYRPDAQGRIDGPGTQGQLTSSLDNVSLAPFGDVEAVERILGEPDSDVAAVFVEPVLCNSGVIAPPADYLARLREICDAAGCLLIFDEVITGFRIARGGATEKFNVVPDLLVLAKAIAGGYPLSAVAGRADLLDRVTSGVVHAGTYNGNPVVLAAASATLDVLGEPGVYRAFDDAGAQLAAGLQQSMAHHGVTGTVNHVGPVIQALFGINSCRSFDEFLEADQAFYDLVVVELLRRGVFALPGGRWYLSTAHTTDDIAATVDIFDEALGAVIATGAHPDSGVEKSAVRS